MNKIQTNRKHALAFLVLLHCLFLPLSLITAENPSLDEFKRLHLKHQQAIHTGMLAVQYSSTKAVDNDQIAERTRFYKERMESEIANTLQSNLSEVEKEKRIRLSERSYEDGLYQVRKNFSGRIEARRIYKIDFIGRLFWLREIPAEEELGEDVFNGAWNRFLVIDNIGHSLEYKPEFQGAVLTPISRDVIDSPNYGGILVQGIITPDRFELFSQLSGKREERYKDQDVVVYELANPEKTDSKLVIYTDPSIGYRYLKTETWYDSKLRYTQIAEDYKSIDTIPFPMYFENRSYNQFGEIRELFQVQEARLNQPFEPNAFTVGLTPDTLIMTVVAEDLNESQMIQSDTYKSKMFRPDPEKSTKLGIREILEQASTAPDYFKSRAQERR